MPRPLELLTPTRDRIRALLEEGTPAAYRVLEGLYLDHDEVHAAIYAGTHAGCLPPGSSGSPPPLCLARDAR